MPTEHRAAEHAETVYVLNLSVGTDFRNDGPRVTVHRSRASAEHYLAAYCRKHWDQTGLTVWESEDTDDEKQVPMPCPADDADVIDAYFGEEHALRDSYELERHDLQGEPEPAGSIA